MSAYEFIQDEAGAATIDWVTLTMGVLLAGIVAIYSIYGGGVSALVDETAALMVVHGDLEPGTTPETN